MGSAAPSANMVWMGWPSTTLPASFKPRFQPSRSSWPLAATVPDRGSTKPTLIGVVEPPPVAALPQAVANPAARAAASQRGQRAARASPGRGDRRWTQRRGIAFSSFSSPRSFSSAGRGLGLEGGVVVRPRPSPRRAYGVGRAALSCLNSSIHLLWGRIPQGGTFL